MDNLYNWIAGGAVLGFIAGFWEKIKQVLWRFANMFVQQVEIPSEQAHNALVSHLIATYPRWRLYDRMYGAHYEHQRDGRYGLIPYELFGNRNIVFWNGWYPFVYSNEQENKARSSRSNKEGSSSGDNGAAKVFSTVTFLRGTLDVEKLLKEACASMNSLSWANSNEQEKQRNRFVIKFVPSRDAEEYDYGHGSNGLAWYQQQSYRLLAHTPEQLGKRPVHNGRALDNLIFPERVKNLIQEIELWRNNRGWYCDKGIPWKRGWMLYGPPGTGKTALARAFAEDLNMPIYVFNLAEMSNHELIKTWSEMQVNVPCIALIEDIDNVFHGRENVAARRAGMFSFLMGPGKNGDGNNNGDNDRPARPFTPLTFDCLLNCLDGVERADGVFTIITTNDISKVDPALGQPRKLPDGAVEFISTRPGRIDKAVELTFMEPADKKRMAKRILGDYPEQYLEMLAFIDRYPGLEETPAQFQERCGQIALAQFWKEQNPPKEKAAPPERADLPLVWVGMETAARGAAEGAGTLVNAG